MSVLIAHASIDENKSIKNGKAGDQTGYEVCVRTWYDKHWNCLIRFTNPKMAEKIAYFMENACSNNAIGYDQNQRNTLLNLARKYNYDVTKITDPCETDCSALVSVACMYAGIPESTLTLHGNCATTRTLRQALKSTGQVEIFTSDSYISQTYRLKRGDILLKEGSHVAVVVKIEDLKSIDEIAKEVIAGKWGSGAARRTKLTNAGYNYETVQKRVNELLKAKQLKPVDEIAKEVIAGKWGSGADRKTRLTNAGYDYDAVQKRVNELLKANKPKDDVQVIWDFLMAKIGNKYGVAGLMGNIKAESNFNPKNMQNSYEKKLGLNDDTYTAAVDSGAYVNFDSDKVGYGLCQWTSPGRKKALNIYKGSKSVGDLTMQLNFLMYELNNAYKNVLAVLRSSKSVKEASDIVLTKFERPKDQSDAVKEYRAKLGQEIYQKYGGN